MEACWGVSYDVVGSWLLSLRGVFYSVGNVHRRGASAEAGGSGGRGFFIFISAFVVGCEEVGPEGWWRSVFDHGLLGGMWSGIVGGFVTCLGGSQFVVFGECVWKLLEGGVEDGIAIASVTLGVGVVMIVLLWIMVGQIGRGSSNGHDGGDWLS